MKTIESANFNSYSFPLDGVKNEVYKAYNVKICEVHEKNSSDAVFGKGGKK